MKASSNANDDDTTTPPEPSDLHLVERENVVLSVGEEMNTSANARSENQDEKRHPINSKGIDVESHKRRKRNEDTAVSAIEEEVVVTSNEIRTSTDNPDSKAIPESFHESKQHLYKDYVIIHHHGGQKGMNGFENGKEGRPVYIKKGDTYSRRVLNDATKAQQIRDGNKRLQTSRTPKVNRIHPNHLVKVQDGIQQKTNKCNYDDPNELSKLRRRIECNGNYFSSKDLENQIPKELAFSLLLHTLRFPVHLNISKVMNKIFQAIEDHPEEQMDYCMKECKGDETKEKNADTVISEAMTLLFDDSNGFQATAQSGNLEAIKLVKQRYPKSITYVDGHGDTPIFKSCEVLNMEICPYLMNWNIEQKSQDKDGLKDDIKSILDKSIDTNQNIVVVLQWFLEKELLTSTNVKEWDLIHRAAQKSPYETIQFLVNLCPSGVMSEDHEKNLPICYFLLERFEKRSNFSDEDFAITKLLITTGIRNGGINTIGGLLHKLPDDVSTGTVGALVKIAGRENRELWDMINECIEEAIGWDNELATGVKRVIESWEHIPAQTCELILSKETNIDT